MQGEPPAGQAMAAGPLKPVPLTPEGFAAFGCIVQPAPLAREQAHPVNDGTALRHEAVPQLDLAREGGRAVLAVYAAGARRFPFDAVEMERHRLSDQVFLPLGAGVRAVILVAPPGAAPAAAQLRAFATDGRQGVLIRAGTWHHALLAVDDGPWAVLERRSDAVDCDVARLDVPLRIDAPD
jgi:ureidoglycolate lyase